MSILMVVSHDLLQNGRIEDVTYWDRGSKEGGGGDPFFSSKYDILCSNLRFSVSGSL